MSKKKPQKEAPKKMSSGDVRFDEVIKGMFSNIPKKEVRKRGK